MKAEGHTPLCEDYVSFETAKLLKEKGFDEACPTAYSLVGKTHKVEQRSVSDWGKMGQVKRPTLQMAMKWLRKKGLHIYAPLEIDYDEDEGGDKWYHDATYYPEIRRVSDGKIMYDDDSLYADPEQAYEVAIKYCLENLI